MFQPCLNFAGYFDPEVSSIKADKDADHLLGTYSSLSTQPLQGVYDEALNERAVIRQTSPALSRTRQGLTNPAEGELGRIC
jgi:hypothetical protein